jgi:GTP-binding protein
MQIVVIIGRPNVGKSTLFNKLIRKRKALVKDEPGVTRDRLYGKVEYHGKQFILVDTGGFLTKAEGISSEVQKQTRLAIEEADRIIFLMDARSGLTPLDRELHEIIRKLHKKSFYVLNKVDNPSHAEEVSAEFYELGVNRFFCISAEHNLGIDELLIAVTEDINEISNDKREEFPKIAIVGRPNVGKSSLVNTLLGIERVVVSEIPGTTRDTVDVLFKRGDKSYIFLDTAGLRKRSKIYTRLEILSSIKSLRAIDESDVSVLLIDAIEGLVSNDLKISQFIFENGKGFVLAVNKWDLIQAKARDSQKIKLKFIEKIESRFKFITHVPVVFMSALTGYGINELLDTIELVMEERKKRVKTSELNRVLREILKEKAPPDYKNREVKINYCTQISTAPPVLVFFTNFPEGIPELYKRYLKNKFYERLGFVGTDIKLLFRKK